MHRANAEFWKEYRALPADIRERSDKQLGPHVSRQNFAPLAVKVDDDYVWFWIDERDVYEGIL